METSDFDFEVTLAKYVSLHLNLDLVFAVDPWLPQEINHPILAYSCLHRFVSANRHKSDIISIIVYRWRLLWWLIWEGKYLLDFIWFWLLLGSLLLLLHCLLTIVFNSVELVDFAVPLSNMGQSCLGKRLTYGFNLFWEIVSLSIALLVPDQGLNQTFHGEHLIALTSQLGSLLQVLITRRRLVAAIAVILLHFNLL